MDFKVLGIILMLINLSSQNKCDPSQCDCTISETNREFNGVFRSVLTCQEGSITWYSPAGALRLEINPSGLELFKTCFIVDSGKTKLKISKEVDLSVDSKTHLTRPEYEFNNHNLKTLLTVQGTSNEYCITSDKPINLYLEPEVSGSTGYQKVGFMYDSAPASPEDSFEECRPCNDTEILKAYCSSDYAIVANMEDVEHLDHLDKTKISVSVAQLIRQKGSHFARRRRDSPHLEGTIFAPRKCGIHSGDGLFLMTGKVRLGELRFGCAPYFEEWDRIVTKAEVGGLMECTRD